MSPAVAIVAASSDVVVPLVIAALVVLGLVLVGVAIWLARRTRPEPELLAPLEAMGARRWRTTDADARRRQLDELRPAGAEPLPPTGDDEDESGAEPDELDDIDPIEEYELVRAAGGYPVYDHGKVVDATPPEQQRPDENQPSLFDAIDDDDEPGTDADTAEPAAGRDDAAPDGDGIAARVRGLVRRFRRS